jgi:hypothetical protein
VPFAAGRLTAPRVLAVVAARLAIGLRVVRLAVVVRVLLAERDMVRGRAGAAFFVGRLAGRA